MSRRIKGAAIPVLMAAIAAPVAAQEVVRLPQRDQAMAGSLAQVFAVGKEEGEHYEVFSNVPSVAFDGNGSLYIVDRDDGRVLVFSKEGRFARQIARHLDIDDALPWFEPFLGRDPHANAAVNAAQDDTVHRADGSPA